MVVYGYAYGYLHRISSCYMFNVACTHMKLVCWFLNLWQMNLVCWFLNFWRIKRTLHVIHTEVLCNTCLYQGCLIGAMEVYMVIDEIVVTRV